MCSRRVRSNRRPVTWASRLFFLGFWGLAGILAQAQTTSTSVTLAWDPSSSSDVVGYNLYSGGASQIYTNMLAVGDVTNATVAGVVPGGTYFFAVTAVDSAGLESPLSVEISYTVPFNTTSTNALPPPVVALTTPVNGASYVAPANIILSASVTTNGHTINQVEFLSGSSVVGSTASAPYSSAWNNVSAGTYSLTAEVQYDGTNLAVSSPVTITVTAPLQPPVVVLTTPVNGASYTAPASVPLAASVTANGHTINQVEFLNGSAVFASVTAAPYSFSWNNVTAGSYSLSAQVQYDGTNAASSAPVTVTVTGLAPPWQMLDIGAVGVAGSSTILNGLYTVSGAGKLNGGSDAFQFLYQTMTGNGQMQGQLMSLLPAGSGGLAGAMIRENLTGGSRYAFMGVTPGGVFRWQRRSNTGGGTASSKSGWTTFPNAWVRVVRNGNTFYGYKSTDGASWNLVNSVSIAMATNVYVGWAVISGSTSSLDTASVTNVSVIP